MKLFLVAGLLLCLAGCDMCWPGCEKTGYEIIITIDSLSYSDIATMESLLRSKGFAVEGKEVPFLKEYPNEVQTTFIKSKSNKPYGLIEVYISYSKEGNDKTVNNCSVRMKNRFIGGIDKQTEIELKQLADEVRKTIPLEKVHVIMRQVAPPLGIPEDIKRYYETHSQGAGEPQELK